MIRAHNRALPHRGIPPLNAPRSTSQASPLLEGQGGGNGGARKGALQFWREMGSVGSTSKGSGTELLVSFRSFCLFAVWTDPFSPSFLALFHSFIPCARASPCARAHTRCAWIFCAVAWLRLLQRDGEISFFLVKTREGALCDFSILCFAERRALDGCEFATIHTS